MRTTLHRRQDLARENHNNSLDKSTTCIPVLLPDILQIFFPLCNRRVRTHPGTLSLRPRAIPTVGFGARSSARGVVAGN